MESKHLKSHNEEKRKEHNELGLITAMHEYQQLKLKSDATGRNSRFKSEENPKGTPYSTLEDAIECANEGLKFGLIFTQSVICEDSQQYLHTVVRHINDTETLQCKYPLFEIIKKTHRHSPLQLHMLKDILCICYLGSEVLFQMMMMGM